MQKKVTIIIPNYNGLKFMEPCFKALRAQSDQNFELLVVDNGSTDGSVKWLEDHQIPSIFLEENTGFSGAVNIGIRESVTPYVILLNNDTEPQPDYVKEMVKAIERSPKIFSVSSKMIQLYFKGIVFGTAGSAPHMIYHSFGAIPVFVAADLRPVSHIDILQICEMVLIKAPDLIKNFSPVNGCAGTGRKYPAGFIIPAAFLSHPPLISPA